MEAKLHYNPQIPELYEPMLLIPRTYKFEIAEIGQLLSGSPLQDDLSELIRGWHGEFTQALEFKNINLDLVFNKFLDQLQELLVHPLTNIPLDEETVLGNDGQAYGYKFLCVHRSKTAAPYHERSPLRPLDTTPFAGQPHSIVRFLIPWLKKYRPTFISEEVEREFSQLPAIPAIPGLTMGIPQDKPEPKPETRLEKIQRIQREQLNREKEREVRNQLANRRYEILDEVIDEMAAQAFAPFNRAVAERQAAMNERLDVDEEDFRLNVAALENRQNQIDERGERLAAELRMLKEELKGLGVKVESAKADNIRLQISIKETEKKINDREKGWFKDLLKAALVFGACWLGTLAAKAVFEALGTTWTASTTSSKGVLNLTLATKL